jgi:hypothetical protein
VRWPMRCGSGVLAGLAAGLVLWGVGPLLGPVLKSIFEGCTDRRDCLTDSIGRAVLAVSVGVALWWTLTLVAGWLVLRLSRTESAGLTAALGMAISLVLWWRFGSLPLLCVPGFAAAAFATSPDLPYATRGGVLGALTIAVMLVPA